jgi:hypothetical protein
MIIFKQSQKQSSFESIEIKSDTLNELLFWWQTQYMLEHSRSGYPIMNGNRESQTFGQSKPRLNVWKRAKMGYNSSVWLLILIVIRVS